MKQAVKVTKRIEDWRWGVRLENDFDRHKKIFWKESK